MPDLPLFVFVAILVVGIVLLLRREHHLLDNHYRGTLDVQNHEGDE